MGSHIAEGFGFALTVYAFVWGMTLPIRWAFDHLGFRRQH